MHREVLCSYLTHEPLSCSRSQAEAPKGSQLTGVPSRKSLLRCSCAPVSSSCPLSPVFFYLRVGNISRDRLIPKSFHILRRWFQPQPLLSDCLAGRVPYLRVTNMPLLTLPRPRQQAKNIYDLLPQRREELGRSFFLIHGVQMYQTSAPSTHLSPPRGNLLSTFRPFCPREHGEMRLTDCRSSASGRPDRGAGGHLVWGLCFFLMLS